MDTTGGNKGVACGWSPVCIRCEPGPEIIDREKAIMKARMKLSIGCVLVALVAFVGTPEAVATQGQPVIAGIVNSENSETDLQFSCSTGLTCSTTLAFGGVNIASSTNTQPVGVLGDAGFPSFWTWPSGSTGVWGVSSAGNGVEGDGTSNGVFGHAANRIGSGVYGQNDGTGIGVAGLFGSGVYGQNDGIGYGVAGRITTSSGAGVWGDAPNASGGVGVAASSAHGTALQVTGTAAFSRSRIATTAGTTATPKNSVVVTVPGGALTANSIVLATIQGNIAGVSVQGVVKGATSFTIFLTKTVTTSVRVGWFIIN
jgi:hypothetical protein